jgi:hypothetical protein
MTCSLPVICAGRRPFRLRRNGLPSEFRLRRPRLLSSRSACSRYATVDEASRLSLPRSADRATEAVQKAAAPAPGNQRIAKEALRTARGRHPPLPCAAADLTLLAEEDQRRLYDAFHL